MSADYYIYLKQLDQFSSKHFEEYCNSLDLCITIHPEFNIFDHSGFVPMRFINKKFSNASKSADFLSGFELFINEYRHEIQPQMKSRGFIQKLFSPKPKKETLFDIAVKDSKLMIVINCCIFDSFEVLLAYVFGAYLVKYYGGVFDDPQSGQFYNDSKHLETEIAAILEELSQQSASGELLTHPFEEWI